jgi:hypothetical protein
MATDQETGKENIRTNFFDKLLKGFAMREYKFKQALTISPTSAWNNIYYRESNTPLAASGTRSIQGLGRNSSFPQAVVQWDRITTSIQKFGLEDNIPWEDILSDDIDVQERTMIRIAEGITKAVDDHIWNTLTENLSAVNIQTVTATAGWEQASAAIIDDLMQAKQKIAEYNYDTSNLICFVSPKDARRLVKYVTDKGAQFNALANDTALNGQVGNIVGIKIIQSLSVSASRALVVVPQRCATWKELVPISSTTITEPYKSVTIRGVEEGICQLTDPKAVVLISGTQFS